MQPNRLSLVALVAGAVMFALPWVEVQCQGRSFLRQTGLQAAVGAVSIGGGFTRGEKLPQQDTGNSMGFGFLIVASGAFAGIALWSAWRAVQDDVHEPEKIGRYAGIAAALLGVQMVIGFPLERGLREEMQKTRGTAGPQSQDASEAAMKQMAAAFQTKYLPALYLYLAVLAVPALQWLTASSRREGSHASTFAPQ